MQCKGQGLLSSSCERLAKSCQPCQHCSVSVTVCIHKERKSSLQLRCYRRTYNSSYTDHVLLGIRGVGRFRILGGQGLEYWGGKGGEGANSQLAHDVVMTSMRRNDVASTSFRRHVPTRFLINQCQIITVLILKSDIIENSRIELRGIVLPVPSNQINVAFIIIIITLQLGTFVIFSCFT